MRSSSRRISGAVLAVAVACLTPLAASTADAGRSPAGDLEGFQADRAAYADAAISMDRVVVPMVFPVVGGASYSDTFLVCRSGCTRKHLGQDLMSPRMRPLVATFNGTVSSVKAEQYVGEGNYITLTGDNGWSVNYIHVNNDTPGTDDGRGTARFAFAPGLRRGLRVVAGQLLGWSGDSGNAEGTAPHTHFELRKGGAWDGVVYNAKPSLDAAPRLLAPGIAGPHPEGTLLRSLAGGPVWLVEDGKKRMVTDPILALNGYSPSQVVKVSKGEIDYYPRYYDAQVRDGVALEGPDGTLWLVHEGARIPVPDLAGLAALGVKPSRVRPVDAATLARVRVAPEGTPLPGLLRNGALVRRASDSKVFYIDGDERRWVPDVHTMISWGFSWDDVIPVPAAAFDVPEWDEDEDVDLDDLPFVPEEGDLLPFRDGFIVKHPVAGWMWLMEDGEKRHIASLAALRSYGYNIPVHTVTLDGLVRQPDGPTWPV